VISRDLPTSPIGPHLASVVIAMLRS
jgi:hypothetical protein